MDPTGARVLELFRASGFISGSETQSVLTLQGQTTIRQAAKAERKVARFFSGAASGDPSGVLLALWRRHFDALEGRTFGGP